MFESINNLSFRSVARLVKEQGISQSTAKMIRNQPGYHPGEEMVITRASTGGWRLYVRVGSAWMDGSKAKSSADKRYEAPPARQFIQDNPEARVPLPGLWMLAPYAPGQVFSGR
jgi:hypothetical protein